MESTDDKRWAQLIDNWIAAEPTAGRGDVARRRPPRPPFLPC